MSYKLIRTGLFLLPPERAHWLALEALTAANRAGLRLNRDLVLASDGVECLGLRFPNRVGLAAGYDKSGDYLEALGSLGFGFIEIGTVTPRAQPGNAKPRLYRLPHQEALINQMGSPNKGIAHAVSKIRHRQYRGIVGVNIGKNADTSLDDAPKDYLEGYRAVRPHADYVTLNISSPNTARLRELQETSHLRRVLLPLVAERCQPGRNVPLLVKVSPDLEDEHLDAIADVVVDIGVDGIIATNTTTSRDGVPVTSAKWATGGVSGRPLHWRSIRTIKRLRKRLGGTFPVVGVGGIVSAGAAIETLEAGANLVQIYAGLVYHGPRLVRDVVDAIG